MPVSLVRDEKVVCKCKCPILYNKFKVFGFLISRFIINLEDEAFRSFFFEAFIREMRNSKDAFVERKAMYRYLRYQNDLPTRYKVSLRSTIIPRLMPTGR